MNDLDIFFDTTVQAVKPALLITNVYEFKKRLNNMTEDMPNYGIKDVMDACDYRDIDTIAVFKIATYDDITDNVYFAASASEVFLDKEEAPNHIYLEIPRTSYDFNVHEYFSSVWSFGSIFDVIWDCENLQIQHEVEKIKPCCNFDAKIKHASEKSPNRRSCITLEIIKDDV